MQIQWGILGTATIAREAVIPAMLTAPYCERLRVAAIASRDRERAAAVAHEFGIERAYGSYEALLEDPAIDAVYIPLPNHLHVPYSIRALEAGKHVLCEKPIALNASEAQKLAAVSRRHPQLKLMEAFMYRLHPQWQWAREIVQKGRLGEVRTIHSWFSFFDNDPSSILHNPDWGGGGLMDIGCYSISLSRFLLGCEPYRVTATFADDPQFEVDRLASGLLEFPGSTATFTCATTVALYQRVHVFGTLGHLELELPFNPPTDSPARAWLEVDGQLVAEQFEVCDQYGIQAASFTDAILNRTTVPTPFDDAVANMRVIDALFRSGRSGHWEQPAA